MSNACCKIYLSGSIRKGEEDARSDDYFWIDDDVETLVQNIQAEVEILNPALTRIDRSDTRLNFGCDLFLVSISTLIVVDLRRKKGIGVGAELMLADQLNIPTFGILGRSSEYQKDVLTNLSGQDIEDWTHPFAEGLCDELFDTVEAACARLSQLIKGEGIASAYGEKSQAAIRYFRGQSPEIVDQYE
ncbi:hypothetical protein [Sulfitobacter geojensis]|uniref:hypothetical protein n=1 Tax=Sulfitobacter geojensis TaxID=1342299 RepID=UPI003B8B510F